MHSLFFFRSSARKSLGASRRLFTALEEGQGDFRLAIATAGRLEEPPYACLCPQVRRSMGGTLSRFVQYMYSVNGKAFGGWDGCGRSRRERTSCGG